MPQIPAGTDVFALLKAMPAAQREALLATAYAKMESINASTVQQADATWITSEYKAVGLDQGLAFHLNDEELKKLGIDLNS